MSQVTGSRWRSSAAHLFFLANFLEPKRMDDLARSLDWERLLGTPPPQAVQELLASGALEFAGAGKPLAERMQQFHVTALKEMLRARDSSLAGNKEELIARLVELDPQAMEDALREIQAYNCSREARSAIEEYLLQANTPARESSRLPAVSAATAEASGATAYLRLGADYGLRGDYGRALDQYRQAVEADPGSAAAYYGQGLSHERQGDYQSALDDYHRAASLDPGQALYRAGRGAAYRKLGHFQLALAEYDKAIALDPTFVAAYHNRGVAYERLGDYRRALEDYDQAIELDSGAALSFLGRGVACEHLGDAAGAAAAYRAVLDLAADAQIRSWAEVRLQKMTQDAESTARTD